MNTNRSLKKKKREKEKQNKKNNNGGRRGEGLDDRVDELICIFSKKKKN